MLGARYLLVSFNSQKPLQTVNGYRAIFNMGGWNANGAAGGWFQTNKKKQSGKKMIIIRLVYSIFKRI